MRSIKMFALNFAWAAVTLASSVAAPQSTGTAHHDLVIKNATVMTVTHGNIAQWLDLHQEWQDRGGWRPRQRAGGHRRDRRGRQIPHAGNCRFALAHRAGQRRQRSDQPHHSAHADDRRLRLPGQGDLSRAGGRRDHSLLLHGSANMIGGQAIVIKHKYGAGRDEMLFPNAPRSIKFASGENPKRVYGGREQLPSTRMGNFAVQREALVAGAGLHARVGRLQRKGRNAATKTRPRPSTI